MKKRTKVILAALSLTAAGVTTTATAVPAFAADDTTNDVMVISTQDQKQTVPFPLLKRALLPHLKLLNFLATAQQLLLRMAKLLV